MDKIDIGFEAIKWHRKLQPSPVGHGDGNLQARALLERASTPTDAYLCHPMVIDLHNSLGGHRYDDCRVGAIAAVLAGVRINDAMSVPKRLMYNKVNQHTVKQLMAASTDDDVLYQFRRLVRLMGNRANVASIAEAMFDWTNIYRGDIRKRSWMYKFYS